MPPKKAKTNAGEDVDASTAVQTLEKGLDGGIANNTGSDGGIADSSLKRKQDTLMSNGDNEEEEEYEIINMHAIKDDSRWDSLSDAAQEVVKRIFFDLRDTVWMSSNTKVEVAYGACFGFDEYLKFAASLVASEQKERIAKMFGIIKRCQMSNIWCEGKLGDKDIDKLFAEAREMIYEYQQDVDFGIQKDGEDIFKTKDLPGEFSYHLLYCSIIRHKLAKGKEMAAIAFRMFRYIIMMVIVAQALRIHRGSVMLENFLVQVMNFGKIDFLQDCDKCLYLAINLQIMRVDIEEGVAVVWSAGSAPDMSDVRLKGVIAFRPTEESCLYAIVLPGDVYDAAPKRFGSPLWDGVTKTILDRFDDLDHKYFWKILTKELFLALEERCLPAQNVAKVGKPKQEIAPNWKLSGEEKNGMTATEYLKRPVIKDDSNRLDKSGNGSDYPKKKEFVWTNEEMPSNFVSLTLEGKCNVVSSLVHILLDGQRNNRFNEYSGIEKQIEKLQNELSFYRNEINQLAKNKSQSMVKLSAFVNFKTKEKLYMDSKFVHVWIELLRESLNNVTVFENIINENQRDEFIKFAISNILNNLDEKLINAMGNRSELVKLKDHEALIEIIAKFFASNVSSNLNVFKDLFFMMLKWRENPSVKYFGILSNTIIQMDKSGIIIPWVILIPCLLGNIQDELAGVLRPAWSAIVSKEPSEATNIVRFKDAIRDAYETNQLMITNKSRSSSSSSRSSDYGKKDWSQKKFNLSNDDRTINYTKAEKDAMAQKDCKFPKCDKDHCYYKHSKEKYPHRYPEVREKK